MIRYAMPVLVAGFLLAKTIAPMWTEAAPAPKLTEADKEMAKLQGTWIGVTCQAKDSGDGWKATDARLTFDNGKFTFQRGKAIMLQGTYTIDVTKDPKTIDMTITKAYDRRIEEKVVLGVFKVEKDMLQWCWFDPMYEHSPKYPPRGRPEITPTDYGDLLFTFKKAKPKRGE